jgi:hypothetical protein
LAQGDSPFGYTDKAPIKGLEVGVVLANPFATDEIPPSKIRQSKFAFVVGRVWHYLGFNLEAEQALPPLLRNWDGY